MEFQKLKHIIKYILYNKYFYLCIFKYIDKKYFFVYFNNF